MKLFIKKIFILSVVILLLPFFLILSLELQFKNIDTSNIYPKYLKLNRDKKEFPLDILIAGDSRAERQIIPEILKGKNQKNILNLAISSGDVNRLRDFIHNRKEAKSLFNNKTILLLSTSPWQIDDNQQKWGYLSYSTFKYLSLYEKFDILNNKKDYLKYVLSIHKFNLRNIFNLWSYESEIDTLGYFAVQGDITNIPNSKLDNIILNQKQKWNDIKENGYRWEEFKKSIKFFSGEFDKVIIIINPETDVWRKSIENTNIEHFNKNFIIRTEEFIKNKNLSNILIWNFNEKSVLKLNDSDFYDTHHLNDYGAKKFTSILREKLNTISDSVNKP
jgi:hypothetical protein